MLLALILYILWDLCFDEWANLVRTRALHLVGTNTFLRGEQARINDFHHHGSPSRFDLSKAIESNTETENYQDQKSTNQYLSGRSIRMKCEVEEKGCEGRYAKIGTLSKCHLSSWTQFGSP